MMSSWRTACCLLNYYTAFFSSRIRELIEIARIRGLELIRDDEWRDVKWMFSRGGLPGSGCRIQKPMRNRCKLRGAIGIRPLCPPPFPASGLVLLRLKVFIFVAAYNEACLISSLLSLVFLILCYSTRFNCASIGSIFLLANRSSSHFQ